MEDRRLNPFLTQLAELCRTERTRAKWVIVPTHTLGHTLGERLALGGAGWANVRFTTPLDLALYVGGGGDGAARATGCRVPVTPRRGGGPRWAFMSLTLYGSRR